MSHSGDAKPGSGTPATVSVVTPCLNHAAFVEETIHSVISQAGDFFIDYLVIDGGSTDGSVDIIRRCAELVASGTFEPRCQGVSFRWLSEKDRGQTHAINKGLAMARGEILSYLNSDDLHIAGGFAAVVRHFADHPQNDFVYGDGDVIDERGKLLWEWLSRPYDYSVLRSYHPLWNDFTNYIMQQATFWRRRVHDRIGLLDETFHYSMDLEFWLRAGSAGLSLCHIPVKLGRFRMIVGTKSLSSPTVFWLDNMEIFRRHNAPRSMTRYFTFFHFNHALHAGLDFEVARGAEARLFERWRDLPPEDVAALRRRSGEGGRRAYLLAALTALERGNREQANHFLGASVVGRPGMWLHPLAWLVLLALALGPRAFALLRRCWDEIVKAYRNKRYRYRYV
ncbi:MAG TPA: glycosyltransferase family 2 protein [Vicinamibacteria bacterium]|nr:glycosyltransferase family 2 protein [Vicinamibacteria bacterium]